MAYSHTYPYLTTTTKKAQRVMHSTVFLLLPAAFDLDTRNIHWWFTGLRKNLDASYLDRPCIHLLDKLKIWSELDSFSSRGQRLVLEGLGASWWKPLIKRAGEPVGRLMKQGHLGFTWGGRVSITTHLCCTAKTIVGSSTVPRSTLSLKPNVKIQLSQRPPLPSRSLFAITEGGAIA